MGGFTPWRNFLFHLFRDCFSNTLTSSSFKVCIIDLMQFLAPIIKNRTNSNGTFFNVDDIIHQIITTVNHYMNIDDNANAPTFSHSIVVLMDSILNVPKNKVITQQSRDVDTTTTTSSLKRKSDNIVKQEEDVEVETEREEVIPVEDPDSCILDEIRYYELIKKLHVDEDHHLLIKYNMNNNFGSIPSINGSTLWRSLNLKWQIYRMITHELLQLELKKNTFLVIDEGIAISEAIYESNRKCMIHDYHFEDRNAYDKEVLVSNLILRDMVERFVLWDDYTVSRIRQSNKEFVGEADIKLIDYITPHNGSSTYLVVSQDTDVIFILLMHMKRFINPQTGKIDDSFELILDTQTPADKHNGISRPYRYINIKKLWIRMNEFFHQEYYTLKNPIETFVFLVNSLKTDFTSSFHSYLRITPRVIWDAFSELHYTPLKKPLSQKTVEDGYILFNDSSPSDKTVVSLKRSNKSNYTSTLRHVLDDAIKYECNNKTYHYILNTVQIEKFFYQLVQIRLVNDMASLGYRQFQKNDILSKNKAYIASPSDLFIYANDLTTKIEEYRKNLTSSSSNEHYSNLFNNKPTLNKNFQPLFSMGSPKTTTATTTTPVSVSMPQLNKKQQEFLKKLSSKDLPFQFGIPTEKQMKARIYRINWILEYYQNGGLDSKYGRNYGDVINMDHNISLWGWICEHIRKPTMKEYNSTYLYSKANDTHDMYSGTMPFHLFTTKETDEIFNRNNRAVRL